MPSTKNIEWRYINLKAHAITAVYSVHGVVDGPTANALEELEGQISEARRVELNAIARGWAVA